MYTHTKNCTKLQKRWKIDFIAVFLSEKLISTSNEPGTAQVGAPLEIKKAMFSNMQSDSIVKTCVKFAAPKKYPKGYSEIAFALAKNIKNPF